MGRKLYLSLALFIFTATVGFAQTGEIKGKVIDKETKQGVPFATVTAESNGTVVGGNQTDIDGKYSIKPLAPGKYNVKVSYVGYNPSERTGVIVSVENAAYSDFELNKGIELGAVEVVSYKIPLIDKGNTTTQTTVTQEEIKNAPTRDVNSIASTTAGIYQQDVGGALNIRGSRSDATAYYVDGIKLSGSYSPPQSGTEQVTVITGGVPAQYGDATGGIISISTRGPSKEYFGGIEAYTSKLFDDYNSNLVGFNLSGPIIMKRDTSGRKSSSLAGFFISGEYQYNGDPIPSAIGTYIIKPDVLSSLEVHPLVKSQSFSGFDQRADFLTYNDLNHVNAHANVADQNINLSGKIDIIPAPNVTVTLGGSFTHDDNRSFTYIYSLLNYDKNPESIGNSYRMFARLTQKFSNYTSGEKSSSAVKNAFYSIQFDYTDDNGISQSADHQDNLFDYGYVGKFKTYRAPFYQQTDTAHYKGNLVQANVQTSVQDTLVTFTPSGINAVMSNYTSDYYALAPAKSAIVNGNLVDYYTTITDIPQQGGLINGDNRIPLSVYSLWGSPGRQPNGYSKADNQQYRITAQGSADIKNHSIVIGMEYEQRIDRGYSTSPSGLWTLARQLGNFNNQQLDFANPHPVINQDSVFQNTINYDQKYVPKTVDGLPVKGFFENVRDKLGIPYNQLIDIDSYDPSTFSLNMFTPDELLNNGNSYVSYYGYDYLGNATSGNVSLSNFLTNKDAGNNYTRSIGAFQPNYVAGYIQDKFAYNDLNFNIGLRVDRYDANQPVLKDKYLLYSAHTAGEVASGLLPVHANVPSNIPSSATVYVNDVNTPTNVVGYRSGDQFYDANGNAIADYSLISQSPITTNGVIQPYLINPSDFANQTVRADAFTQYTPQVNYMPRIAFSFPISDEALFFAHYDVLTQRPPSSSQFNPVDYLFFETLAGGGLPNPALKPERTTDYELGFKQALTRSSALSISAYYKELRDMIEVVAVNGAFPINYISYGNQDFGTVKGLSLSYDLRRTGNIRMTANYTLQFADGTGSNPGAQFNVIAAGIPNLRTPMPLNFDQRNTITSSIDYRYAEGKDYNGPMWFGKQFLANTGLNLVFRAGSGTPYTAQSNITADVISGLAERTTLAGSINGSSLPWTYRMDAKLDRDFVLKVGKEREGKGKKRYYVNAYIQVQNLLNTQNVIAVYRATGNPNDNGYLSAASSQASIAQQVNPASFRDLFAIAVNNPGNYSLPRRMNFGIKLNFD